MRQTHLVQPLLSHLSRNIAFASPYNFRILLCSRFFFQIRPEKRREKGLSNGPAYRAWRANNVAGSVDTNPKTPDTSSAAYCMLYRAVTRAFSLENGALYGDLYGHIYYCKRLLCSTNLSKISSNSMNSGPFASTHTSKVAHLPCAPAPLSMVQ
jgi:hypothetical protein